VLTAAAIRRRLDKLDRLLQDEYKPAHPKPTRDWSSYETQWRRRLQGAARELAPLVHQACDFETVRGPGRRPAVALHQRVLMLLLKTLFGKSNRVMANLLVFFGLLAGIDVSYKTVERLYSDAEVAVALENLHRLMLDSRGVEVSDCSGDGTGYGLSITRHYASTAAKQREKAKENPVDRTGGDSPNPKKVKRWVYSFRLLDLRTRMFIATGTSLRSEREAYDRALVYLHRIGVSVDSVRLDRLYSHPGDAQKFPAAWFYVIPRKNIAHLPLHDGWLRSMRAFVEDTIGYLERYYQRQHSEAAFGADKRLLGWTLAQRREDRLDTAAKTHLAWHNLVNLHGPDHTLAPPLALSNHATA